MATEESMQEAAQIWCRPSISGMEMDTRLAEAVADLLDGLKAMHIQQLAAISTAAMGYLKKDCPINDKYKTAALSDVQGLYAKYEALYKQSS